MTLHCSQSRITTVLSDLLLPHSHPRFKSALTELARMQTCSNFIEEFLTLSLHPDLNESQKMAVLKALELHLGSNRQASIDFNTVLLVFSIFNRAEVQPVLKSALLELMCCSAAFARAREVVMKVVLHRLAHEQIRQEDLFIIYVSQYILRGEEQWSAQLSFIQQLNHTFERIARALASAFKEQKQREETLLEIVKLFRIVAGKLRNITFEQQLSYINSDITDILHQFLSLPLRSHSNRIKDECFELLDLIFTMTCEYLSQDFAEVKSILYVPQTLQEAITFLGQFNQTHESGCPASPQSCIVLILNIYKHLSMFPGLILPDQELLCCLVKTVSLRKLHYDNYYNNSQEFIDFIRQLLSSQAYSPLNERKEMSEDSIDIQKRYLTGQSKFIAHQQAQKVELHEKLNQYHYTCLLIEEICRKNQQLSISLMKEIINVLFYGHCIEGLERSTCMILIGLLKKEVTKRAEMLTTVSQILLKQLENAMIPTRHTEEPQNIHFFILIAISERYLQQIFADCLLRQQILFKKLIQVLNTKKAETSLVLMCSKVLQGFTHKAEYAVSIIGLIRNKISSSDNPVVLRQFMSTYLSLMQSVLYIPDTCSIFHLAMLELCAILQAWHDFESLRTACSEAIRLLFDYKHYLHTNCESNQWKNVAYSEIIAQFSAFRTKIVSSSPKQTRIINEFDRFMLKSFNLKLENDNSGMNVGFNIEQALLLDVLDRFNRLREPYLMKQVQKMMCMLLGRLDFTSKQLNQRVPELLGLLLAEESFSSCFKNLILVQSHLIAHQRHFATEQIINLCKLFQRSCYLREQSSSLHLQALQLIGRMVLSQQGQACEEGLMKMLFQGRDSLNYNSWTNQASIYLISHLLIKTRSIQVIIQLFSIAIPLLDCNMRQAFSSTAINDEEKDSQMAIKMPYVDEWSSFRAAIASLRQAGLWEGLRGHFCPMQQEILRKSFMCESISHKTRMIVRSSSL